MHTLFLGKLNQNHTFFAPKYAIKAISVKIRLTKISNDATVLLLEKNIKFGRHLVRRTICNPYKNVYLCIKFIGMEVEELFDIEELAEIDNLRKNIILGDILGRRNYF